MSGALQSLSDAVASAASRYHRLVILAGPMGSGKSKTLRALVDRDKLPLIRVNLELSRRMLELPRGQRPRQIERLLRELVASVPGEVVLLDNLEMLFDPSLAIDPLRLLRAMSRHRTIVASWACPCRDGMLSYAAPGHPEYRPPQGADALIIPTTDVTLVD